MNAGLLLLRLVIGLTFAAHGSQKLFGTFDGPGPKGTAGFMGMLGFRAPLLMGLAAGGAEFVGGLAFAAGIATPLAALALTVVMVNAVITVHLSKGFFSSNGGYEFNLALATVCVAVAAIGPGRFSLDRAIHWDDNISGFWWGVGVAGAALALGLLTTTLGRRRTAAVAPVA